MKYCVLPPFQEENEQARVGADSDVAVRKMADQAAPEEQKGESKIDCERSETEAVTQAFLNSFRFHFSCGVAAAEPRRVGSNSSSKIHWVLSAQIATGISGETSTFFAKGL